MSDLPEVEIISRLLALAERYGVETLEAEEGGLKVSLQAPARGPEEGADENGSRYALWRLPPWQSGEPRPQGGARPPTAQALHAPLTGTFYRAGSPDAPPMVEVGDTVEEGQPVGLIEAMKVFSEVAADRPGVIVEITAQNGKLVQHGDVLMYIDPTMAT